MKQNRTTLTGGLATIALRLLFAIVATSPLHAATYHVDAVNGNDSSGDGSSGSPYASLTPVMSQLSGGDTVMLYSGNYGSIEYISQSSDIFNDWVTFQAAEGHTPEIDEVLLHSTNSGTNFIGSFDAYIRIVGCDIIGANRDNAVALVGARYVEIEDCRLEVHGPWVGSEANVAKTGFYARYTSHVTVKNCEITRTGIGVAAQGYNVNILDNHIYDITHDGIRATGLEDSLVAGNYIHGLDDGVDDGEATWSKHCDGIHIFIAGSSIESNLKPNDNVIFRGNVIHDIESQAVQFNNYAPFPNTHNANIIFENNIFGPVNAVFVFNDAEPVDGLIIRNNSFLHIPNGTTYVSPNNGTQRTIVSDNYGLRVTEATSDLEVYNNILPYGAMPTDTADVFENNVIFNTPSYNTYVGGPSNIATTEEQFVNPTDFDGALLNTSWAINRSSTTLSIHSEDIYGVTRSSPAEAGAAEYFVNNANTPLPTVGRWELDQDATDDSGLGNDGVLLGDPAYTTDHQSGSHALQLDGSGDSVRVDDSASLRVTGDLTLAAFIKPTNTGTHQNIISKSFNDGYRLRVTNSGKLQIILGIPGSGSNQVVGSTSTGSVQYGAWQHVSASVEFNAGSAYIEFYIDGVLDSTDTLTLSGIEAGTADLFIGAGTAANELYTGMIDQALIFDYAISGSDVLNNISANNAPTISSIDDVTMNIEAELEILASSEDQDGDLMTLTSSTLPSFISFKDHHNGRASIVCSPQTGDSGNYSITVTVSDGVDTASTTFDISVQVADTAAYWSFDGSFYEESGWNHPVTIVEDAAIDTDSAAGSHALSLNGVDEYLLVPDNSTLQITGDLTIAAHVKTTQSGSSQNIAAKSFNDGYRLRLTSANKLQLILGNGGSVVGATSSGTISTGSWTHVAATVSFSGATAEVKLYINGALDSTTSLSLSSIEAGSGELIIGAGRTTPSELFQGLLDDVRIYDRALSQMEIQNLP